MKDFATSCKGRGVKLSLDPNVRPSLIVDQISYRNRINRFIAISDILKLSDEDLYWLFPDCNEAEAFSKIKELSKLLILLIKVILKYLKNQKKNLN